jgi:hypothetical protein
VTQLPDDLQTSSSTSTSMPSNENKINNNSQVVINLKERVPLISSNIVYKKTVNNTNELKDSNKDSPSSSNAAVLDWDSILHKGVRTKDMQAVGVVAAITDDSIVVTSEGAKDEYNIPKDEVSSYNGSEVIINPDNNRLSQFISKVPK